MQRYTFNTRFRKPGESIAAYIAELRAIAQFCNYGNTLDLMLRDRLVCGVNDAQIQRRLLADAGELTFETALKIAVGMETATKNFKTLQGAGAGDTTADLHKVNQTHSKRATRSSGEEPCYRCGQTGHAADKCRFKSSKCHGCGRIGHIKAACRSLGKKQRSQQRTVKQLQAEPQEPETDSNEYSTLFSLESSRRGQKPFEVELQIDGCPLRMEVDTGASLLLMSEATFSPCLLS